MSGFSELMKKRRSVRDYEDRKVPLQVVMELIADAYEAPRGGNRQPWAFVVVQDARMIRRLSDESKRNILADEEAMRSPALRQYRPVLSDEGFNVFYNAPCLVYITAPKGLPSAAADCSLAAAYFMLSAAERGLGTCWVNLGSSIKDPDTLKTLCIPDDHRIMATIILGYPRTIPERPPRNDPRILAVIG